ncbi:MAG TPA: phosphoribosylpyrophosphate synthetase [Rhodospirillaceae bacterium]|nr:phosphoribosylpyrophosphate synthetase [Rhodospirillaceae bacterium]
MKLISCTSNQPLAEAISAYLGIPLTEANVKRFADQEIFLEVLDNVRGEDVFVIQPTSYPANDHLMELLIMIDALKRGSARRITAVIPYFGYARQDRKTTARSPISAKLVANLITTAGADRVLTMDLHAGQIQGFFDIPVDNLFAGTPVFVPYIQKACKVDNLTIVSPDVGGVVRARAFAKRLDDAGLAIIDKRRERAGISEVMHVIGEVAGRDCILIDDMVDSAGTICNAAAALMEHGAASVRAVASHGVFSGSAVERIEKSPMVEMLVTDSIRASDKIRSCAKIKFLSVAPLFGEAILRISEERSVSSLFDTVPASA